MAFKHGTNCVVYFNGRNFTQYFSSATISSSADTAEASTFSDSAKVYVAGLRDATVSLEGFFEPSVSDAVLRTALAAEGGELTILPQGGSTEGTTVGYGFNVIENSYEIEEPVDGVGSISCEFQSSSAAERTIMLQALNAETTSGNGGTHDAGAASSNGGSAYLHVMAASGTSPTLDVVLYDSAASGMSPKTSLGTFSQVTSANTSQRITFSGEVLRYVRAEWTIGGTSPSFQFYVDYHRAS